MSLPIHVLSIEQDPKVRNFITSQLSEDEFTLDFIDSCEALLHTLNSDAPTVDVILIDMDMEGPISSQSCLESIRAIPKFQNLPIILQADHAERAEIRSALKAGAYYFLHKSAGQHLLHAVIISALENRKRFDSIEQEKQILHDGLAYVEEARFKIRTLDDIKNLTALLCSAYPDPDRVTLGIHELLTNAIEHGNLAITYDEKSQLIMNENWREEVNHRLTQPHYAHRFVYVHLKRSSELIALTITDEGQGFDSAQYLEIDPARMFDPHGRGIAVAKSMSFDTLSYNEKGNEVTATIILNQEPTL